MADMGRWFKLWCDAPHDEDLDALDIGDFGRWAKLGAHTKAHGTDGTLRIPSPGRGLCSMFQVADFEALESALRRLPHLDVRRENSSVTLVTVLSVTFRNWKKYQGDFSGPRVRKFREMKRSKRRGEETRGDEKRNTPPPPCPECQRIVQALNDLTGRNYQVIAGNGMHSRHQDHGIDSCLRVVRIVGARLMGSPKTAKYARPKTLFGPENFEEYLVEAAERPEDSVPLSGEEFAKPKNRLLPIEGRK